MQAIKMNISGIKCDNKECDFKDMTVLFEDYADWLNKPCPKCGGNLLTEQDFKTIKFMVRMTKQINRFIPGVQDDTEQFKVKANLNGTGKVTFSEIEPIKRD